MFYHENDNSNQSITGTSEESVSLFGNRHQPVPTGRRRSSTMTRQRQKQKQISKHRIEGL